MNQINVLLINRQLRRIAGAASVFVVVFVLGVVGLVSIEKYKVVDALYMAVITVSTIGFAEVKALSPNGRIFMMVFIVLSRVSFTATIYLITVYLFEGELQHIYARFMTKRETDRLENHVIVCGYGRNGRRAAEELARNNVPYVVIDVSAEALPGSNGEKLPFVVGDATRDEVLQLAGIERAKALISTLPADADNVFVTLAARELNAHLTIVARADRGSSASKLRSAGATHVVLPGDIGGMYMANHVIRPELIELLEMISGAERATRLHWKEYLFSSLKPEFKDKPIRQFNATLHTGASLVGFKEAVNGFSLNPDTSLVMQAEDCLVAMGTAQALADFEHYFLENRPVSHRPGNDSNRTS